MYTGNLFADFDEQSSHTSVIRQHYVFLLETLDVELSGLVRELYSKEVVSAEEREEIAAEKTSSTANEKLLSVLNHKSSQQFQLFLNALDNCRQQHVRNVIAEEQRGLSTLLYVHMILAHMVHGWEYFSVCEMFCSYSWSQ